MIDLRQYVKCETALAQERFGDAVHLVSVLPETPQVLWLKGLALRGLGDLANAANTLAQAAQLQNSELHSVDCRIDLALTYTRMGDVDQAIELLRHARPVFEAHGAELGLYKCDFGDCAVLSRQGQYAAVVPRLIEIAERFAALNAPSWQVAALALASNCCLLTYELNKALTLIERAYPIASQQNLAFRLGQLDYQAAWVALEQGDTKRAKAHLAKSRRFSLLSGARLLDIDLRILESNMALADGDMVLAEAALESAARAYLEIGYRDGAAIALSNVGQLRRDRGAMAAAINALQAAIALGSQNDEGRARAAAWLALGGIYRAIRLYPAARDILTQAQAYFSERAIWPAACAAGAELALVVPSASLTDTAQSALRLIEQCGACVPRALAQRTLGEVLAQVGRLDEAQEHLRASAAYFRQAGYGMDWMVSELARLELTDLSPEALCEQLDAIAPLARGLPDCEARIAILRARAQDAMGCPRDALSSLRVACDAIALLRMGAADIVLSAQLSAIAERFFVEAISLAVRLEDDEALLELCEHRRSHWLRKMLVTADRSTGAQHQADHLQAIDKSFLELQVAVRAARETVQAGGNSAQAHQALAAAQDHAQAVHAAYARVNEARLGDLHQATTQVRDSFAVVEPDTLRARLSRLYGPIWTAVSINPLDQTGQSWVVITLTPDTFVRRVVVVSPRIAFLLEPLSRPDADAVRVAFAGASGHKALSVIADWLGVDGWVRPDDSDRPILIADTGPFMHLPFAALPVHGQMLVQHASVRFCLSWELALLLAERRRAASEPVSGTAALLVAPIEFPAPLPPLRASTNELSAISDSLTCAGGVVESLIGDMATAERVRLFASDGKLERFHVMHFSAHGVYLPDYPRMNGICLRDGHLTLQEILAWRLNADLVSVSACDGGRRISTGGADEIGLELALHAAGARQVLSSLWRQPDSQSAKLMAGVFERYAAQPPANRDSARALAGAQRALLSSHIAAHTKQATQIEDRQDWAGWRVSGP